MIDRYIRFGTQCSSNDPITPVLVKVLPRFRHLEIDYLVAVLQSLARCLHVPGLVLRHGKHGAGFGLGIGE